MLYQHERVNPGEQYVVQRTAGPVKESSIETSLDHVKRPIPGKLCSRLREQPDQNSAGGQKALEGRFSGKNIKGNLIYLTIWKVEVIVKGS